ncbi:hypothetical protein BJX64DRAFT_258503 [Aspergillus heterothallicus]
MRSQTIWSARCPQYVGLIAQAGCNVLAIPSMKRQGTNDLETYSEYRFIPVGFLVCYVYGWYPLVSVRI